LLKLLTKEPEARIEIEEALRHPWIKVKQKMILFLIKIE